VSSLRVERIESAEALAALRPEWQRLAAAHGGGLPFATWEWSSVWWAHFRERNLGVHDRLFARAIRSASGELLGVAPLMLTERPGVGPVRVRTLQFLGADPNVTELRGVLCDPAHEREVYAALLAHLRACGDEWDWMIWLGMREGSPAARLLGKQPNFSWVRSFPDFVLRPKGTWEDFKSSRSRNIKESLRKCYNSLKRDGHDFTFTVARSRAEVAQGLDVFLRLHGARAQQDSGVQHSNVFASINARGFLAEICQRMAEHDQVRLFQLRIGGEVVATRIGFALGKALYLYYSGYDPEWGRYSVMTTTVAESLKHAIHEGFELINLSTGNDVSKTRWSPEELTYCEGIHLSETLRARAAWSAYHKAREVLEDERTRSVAQRLLGRRSK